MPLDDVEDLVVCRLTGTAALPGDLGDRADLSGVVVLREKHLQYFKSVFIQIEKVAEKLRQLVDSDEIVSAVELLVRTWGRIGGFGTPVGNKLVTYTVVIRRVGDLVFRVVFAGRPVAAVAADRTGIEFSETAVVFGSHSEFPFNKCYIFSRGQSADASF